VPERQNIGQVQERESKRKVRRRKHGRCANLFITGSKSGDLTRVQAGLLRQLLYWNRVAVIVDCESEYRKQQDGIDSRLWRVPAAMSAA
jgi:hypothetical protein